MQRESTESSARAGAPGFEASPSRAVVWAIVIAGVLLVTTVMPAEYGIDWTGAGRLLGLTPMGQRKVATAKAAASPEANMQAAAMMPALANRYAASSKRSLRTDLVEVTLPPNGEVEYKTVLAEGEGIVYEWDAGGADVKFDFHGEPSAGPPGAFLSFDKASAPKGAGTLTAPFAGTHGWYWKNPAAVTIIIKLKVSGFHSELKRM